MEILNICCFAMKFLSNTVFFEGENDVVRQMPKEPVTSLYIKFHS